MQQQQQQQQSQPAQGAQSQNQQLVATQFISAWDDLARFVSFSNEYCCLIYQLFLFFIL